MSKARAAVLKKLNDPESARFSDVRVVMDSGQQIVCGRVNAKNGFGGYAGFNLFQYDQRLEKYGAIIYGGSAITDDPISGLAQLKGYEDSCGRP